MGDMTQAAKLAGPNPRDPDYLSHGSCITEPYALFASSPSDQESRSNTAAKRV